VPVVLRRFIQCVRAALARFNFHLGHRYAASSSAVYFNADGARRATASIKIAFA
jgi:hypothetical protein